MRDFRMIVPPDRRARLKSELFQEIPLAAAVHPRDIFLKRAEYRILESIALAITGRTVEFAAGLERTAEEHPPESPYRAAALVAVGGLTSHTGHFRGVVDDMRGHIAVLRAFRDEVSACPRRLEWAFGMGAYFMNMNLALMGLPLDEHATAHGFEVADRLGFADLRIYHLFSQIVRASFIGDGSAFTAPFAEMNDLMRKLGNPRLPERNLAIYTPPYYLERGELELARAVVERGERLVTLLPGDRWLALYADVYRACLHVMTCGLEAAEAPDAANDAVIDAVNDAVIDAATAAATDAALSRARAVCRASDFRMETLVLIYRSRFELLRHDAEAARAAALAALARATDPLRANPFDEILARRALADVQGGADASAELSHALALAVRTRNVLQEGIVRLSLADRSWRADRRLALAQLDAAEASFTAARADRWLRRAQDRRSRADDAPPRSA